MEQNNALAALLQNQVELQAAVRELARQQERGVNAPRPPGDVLTKLNNDDDLTAYLEVFERIAARERWPVADWGTILAGFLTGEAQQVCSELPLADSRDYRTLKTALLAVQGNSLPARAQKVHDWRFNPALPARTQINALTRHTNRWLLGEGDVPIVDRVVIDRCIRGLPPKAREYASNVAPRTLPRLVELVENFYVTQDLLKTGHGEAPKSGPDDRRPKEKRRGQGPSEQPPPSREGTADRPPRGGSRRCYVCGRLDHIAWACPERDRDVSMASAASEVSRPALHAQGTASPKFDIPVRIDGKDARAMLDSGSAVTLVRADLAGPLTDTTVPVTCVHGDVRRYPTTELRLQTPRGDTRVNAGVVPALPVPLLMGYDCELFSRYWDPGRRPPPKRRRRARARVPTDAQRPRAACPAYRGQDGEAPPAGPSRQSNPTHLPSSTDSAEPESPAEEDGGDESPDPFAEFPTPETPANPTPGDFATCQWDDPNLRGAREQLAAVDGKLNDGVSVLNPPYFCVNKGLLYRGVRGRDGEIVEQLLVPKSYVSRVLYLAHTHQLGAHLGVQKTYDRVLGRFYWPGAKRAVESFCRHCPECQLVAPRSPPHSPLIPLPLIDVPFSRIAMDIVGPLPKSNRGHRYVLVIVDYATRFPEAIPLRSASAKAVAHEIFMLASRVGIPDAILTDQGTCFMSQIITMLYKWLNVTRIRTSVYHPQTDGLVERFNQTLKRMLKKLPDADGKDWDRLIPYVMFAIREVPQASTGFSPFELLYGRQPRGLLDLAREAWETQPSPHRSVIDHIEQMQARARRVWPLVREHMTQAQQEQSRAYNRGAARREFQVGDKVLVLVPTSECKFLAKWQGPFEVIKKTGPVNYKVSRPGRRKGENIYHVNLLKPWFEPEPVPLPVLLTSLSPPSSLEVPIGEDLSPRQRQEVRELLLRYQDRFSELPGRTNMLRHDIITDPGQVVRQRPYRIPEARRAAIKEEVGKMLDLGVIEESHSPWSSPIVIVPKPDGSLRFCNDFRKLNDVSRFDSYPMPRADEMIERLGAARFVSTLDLTKGYWQVPLTDRAKAKTAFSTPQGLFQYTVMPFGVHGAPATFQRLMDRVLRPHQNYSSAYIDDIIVFSVTWELHLQHLEAVLSALRAANLTANAKKCQLGLTETNYLGHTIGRGCVKPQQRKLERIRDWPRPTTRRQVKSFLGLMAYYQKFVNNFATIAAPLYDLTSKGHPNHVKWSPEAEGAFQLLKEALCTEPVLRAPDFAKPFVLHTDASGTGLGAVLAQVFDDEEHPITYVSRKLLPHERNYATIEKECLAIKWAIGHLRYYLWGRQFTLITDHAPLRWLATSKDSNARVTRWFLELQDYKFTVEHRPGRAIPHADALSRRYEEGHTSPGESLRGGVCGISTVRVRPRGEHAPGVGVRQRGEEPPRSTLLRGAVIEGRYFPRYVLDQHQAAHLR